MKQAAIVLFALAFSSWASAMLCQGPFNTSQRNDLYICTFEKPLARVTTSLLKPYMAKDRYLSISFDGNWLIIQATTTEFSDLSLVLSQLEHADEASYGQLVETFMAKPEPVQRIYDVNPKYGVALFTAIRPLISQHGYLTYGEGSLVVTDMLDTHVTIEILLAQLDMIYESTQPN